MAEEFPIIPTLPVKSSNIAAIGYQNGVLQVDFKGSGKKPGGRYQYPGVTHEEYTALMTADMDPEKSVGSVFHSGVRKAYKGARLPEEKK